MRSRLVACMLATTLVANASLAADTIVVGSKNFAESRFLGELFAQLIEEKTDLEVERRLGLVGTEFVFEALRNGSVDVYPEYTGTGLVTILKHNSIGDPTEALGTVRRHFLDRWDLHWLAPLGFENTWEMAVRREFAEAHDLRTIGDLSRVTDTISAGFGGEFGERADGLAGMQEFYGFELENVRVMQQALKYQAADDGLVDLIDAYGTDGRLAVVDLVLLEDDGNFFPPYDAVPLVRGETLQRHPEIGAALALLGGALDEVSMRAINLRLQEEKEPEGQVARDVLARLGLLGDVAIEAIENDGRTTGTVTATDIGNWTVQHLTLSIGALILGVVVAVPLGLGLERRRRVAEGIIRGVGTTQTIPSLALLGFLIPVLGVGVVPAIVALWLYSLFPILRNTYTGVRDADPEAVEAALALGMTEGQVLRHVRLPLAVPTIMAGVRTAGVITVGTATLAAFIGAGGLGEPIIAGVQLLDSSRILAGAIPAALLAVGVDASLGLLERNLTPRGLRA
ncbi:MAG: glycine betaine ABC transporter substrate-binding protein [Acidobacteriota bacterium]|nr:glycine betaine ABC transporter substrate-binding protein [Acidobacteriota bacterium]